MCYQLSDITLDDKELTAGSVDIGDVPVVVGRDGRALRLVRDSKTWMRENEPRARNNRKRRARSPVSLEPSNSRRSERPTAIDESRHPSKRPRVEPATHSDHDVQELSRSAASHALYQRHQNPTFKRQNQDAIPLAGPSRGYDVRSTYPVTHTGPQNAAADVLPAGAGTIDATLAAARAKLLAVQKRHEDRVKLAELQKIEEALLAYQEEGYDSDWEIY